MSQYFFYSQKSFKKKQKKEKKKKAETITNSIYKYFLNKQLNYFPINSLPKSQ